MRLPTPIRGALNKAQDWVAKPDTKHFADLGAKFLGVVTQVSQAKMSSPLTVVSAAVGFLNVVSNQTHGGFYNAIHRVAAQRNLKPIDSRGAVKLLFDQGTFKGAEVLVDTDHGKALYVKIAQTEIIVAISKEGLLVPWWPAFVSAGYSAEVAAQSLWVKFGDAVVLTVAEMEYGRKELTAAPIKGYEDLDLVCSHDPEAFVRGFREYRKAGISKAFVLVGPPGTGKTSFTFRCGQLLGGKLMQITPELLINTELPKQEILDIVTAFNPSVLLLDDVDLVTNGDLMLSLMDRLRRVNRGVLIISTVNEPQKVLPALRRPGRLGRRVEFLSPNQNQRVELIKYYCAKFGIDRDLTGFAAEMEHAKFSHDYLRDFCEQALVDSDDVLRNSLRKILEELSVG